MISVEQLIRQDSLRGLEEDCLVVWTALNSIIYPKHKTESEKGNQPKVFYEEAEAFPVFVVATLDGYCLTVISHKREASEVGIAPINDTPLTEFCVVKRLALSSMDEKDLRLHLRREIPDDHVFESIATPH